MKKANVPADPKLAAIDRLESKVNVLIALEAMKSEAPKEKLIKMLYRSGMVYDEIVDVLGVSSATVTKVMKR